MIFLLGEITSHVLHMMFFFYIVALNSMKPPTYTVEDEQAENFRSNFNQKEFDQDHETIDSFTIDVASSESAQLSLDNALRSFTNMLPEQLNLAGQLEVGVSELSYPSINQNVRGDIHVFWWKKNFQVCRNFAIWNPNFPPDDRYCWSQKHGHSGDTITAKVVLQSTCLKERKSWDLSCNKVIWPYEKKLCKSFKNERISESSDLKVLSNNLYDFSNIVFWMNRNIILNFYYFSKVISGYPIDLLLYENQFFLKSCELLPEIMGQHFWNSQNCASNNHIFFWIVDNFTLKTNPASRTFILRCFIDGRNLFRKIVYNLGFSQSLNVRMK